MTFACRYCTKQFQRERSLDVHLCEPKRRHLEQHERGVQLGYQSYLKFYEMTQGSAKLKTVDDFISSQYYKAFVKFGRYCVDIRVVNTTQFLDWLLKNNKKIDNWCKDSVYEEYLLWWLPKEPVQDALERALKEMEEYASNNSGLASFNHYFRYGNTNRICHHIVSGRVSPWCIYNCSSGIEWLDTLTTENLAIVMPYINPDIWRRKFEDYPSDTEWAKHVLREAGL